LTYAGRKKDKEIEQARNEAAAVERVLGSARMPLRRPVSPILCIHGTTVSRKGLFTKLSIQGVAICGARSLVRTLTHKRLDVLDAPTVAELAMHIDAGLRPAAPPAAAPRPRR
jgi:hypothetical protein